MATIRMDRCVVPFHRRQSSGYSTLLAMLMRTFAIACAALALALFVAGAFAVWDGEWGAVRHAHGSELVNDIERAEGFRGREYADPRGFPTIATASSCRSPRPRASYCWCTGWKSRPAASPSGGRRGERPPGPSRTPLRHAGFVLGCTGLLEFTKALHALALSDYAGARAEFRRSDWYRQDPRRVEAVIARLPK